MLRQWSTRTSASLCGMSEAKTRYTNRTSLYFIHRTLQGTTFTWFLLIGHNLNWPLQIRPLWRHYFQNTQGLIFVVDSNDRERITEVRKYTSYFTNDSFLRLERNWTRCYQRMNSAMLPSSYLPISRTCPTRWVSLKSLISSACTACAAASGTSNPHVQHRVMAFTKVSIGSPIPSQNPKRHAEVNIPYGIVRSSNTSPPLTVFHAWNNSVCLVYSAS